MNSFLRRKACRTCTLIVSGAAIIMAAGVNYHQADINTVAENTERESSALMHISDGGDGEEEAAPGKGTEKISLDEPKQEDADFPVVGEPNSEDTDMKNDETEGNSSTGNMGTGENTDSEEKAQEEMQTEPYGTVVSGSVISVTKDEYEALQRIVEAEAGNQDEVGRILVANVILNRVASDKYPNTILENIFKNTGNVYQFEPIQNGYYYQVTVSEKTKECVDRALRGEDYSYGALYFTRQTSENSWFNTTLTLLLVHGPHYFYK